MKRGELPKILRVRILKFIYEKFKSSDRDKSCCWTDIRGIYNSDRAVKEELNKLIKEKFVLPVKIKNKRKSKKLDAKPRYKYLFNPKKEEEAEEIFKEDFLGYKKEFKDYKTESEKEISEKQSFLEKYSINTLFILLIIFVSVGLIYYNLSGGYEAYKPPPIYAYSDGNCTLVVDKVYLNNRTVYRDEICKILLNKTYRREANITLEVNLT